MAAPTIAFVPKVYNLSLYAGDGAALRIVVTDKLGAPVELTGTISAQIRKARDASSVDAAFSVDMTASANGIALITLAGDDTADLGDYSGAWDVQWEPDGSEPVTLMQGSVKCGLDVTHA